MQYTELADSFQSACAFKKQSHKSSAGPESKPPANVELLRSWLNKRFKVVLTDKRTIVGTFLCTDKDANVIMGDCREFCSPSDGQSSRLLGLAMVPGNHIVSLAVAATPS